MAQQAFYNQAHYLTSAIELKQCPEDSGSEVAFIGRSNAGKSSAINAITGIKNLARTSNTPGRTQMINFFKLDQDKRLVDLPGYGYAKVPRPVQKKWEEITSEFLHTREALKGLVLIMDIRHPLKEMDLNLIAWAVEGNVALHILLTKADKISRVKANAVLKEVQNELDHYGSKVSVQIFSSLKYTGIDEAIEKLNQWFELS